MRLQATRAGWLQFGKYWQSRSPFRQRRSLFKGVVQGAALSGLETATGVKGPLTPGEVAPIDRLLVKFGRVLLRGTAKTNAEGVVRAVPNVVIWRRLRLVPTFHELRYRRVAWAQRLSENVRKHDAVLTGLLGQFAFETQSTVAEDGSLADRANPCVQQLLADVLSLLYLESAVDLRAEWDRSVLSLFGQFAESFRKIDLNEARATHWSIAVSPGAKEKNNENVEDVERPFRCLLVTEREQTCGLTFATWRGLTSQQRRPSGDTHGIRHLASLLTVTNACVLCGTTCKSKWAASDHLKRAIRHQRCVLDMTHAHVSLEPITSYSCPACYCSFGTATELQWHLRTHLEPYRTPGYLFVWPAHAVVVAGIGARALRGRTVAAATDQETARRHQLSRYRYRAGSGWGRRRPCRAQAEVHAEENGRGGRRRLQRSRPRVSGPLAGSKAPRCRSSDLLCRAGAEGDVFTLQKHEGGWQEVRAAGGGQGTTRTRSGQSAPPRVPALLSTLAKYVPPQGVDQAVLGRVEGVKTLLGKVIEHQTQAELGEWVTTCRAEDCYDRPQQEKQGRILFATNGTMEVSWRPSDPKQEIPHPLHGPSQQVGEIITKQMSVKSVRVSLLCAQGGKHKVGAAP